MEEKKSTDFMLPAVVLAITVAVLYAVSNIEGTKQKMTRSHPAASTSSCQAEYGLLNSASSWSKMTYLGSKKFKLEGEFELSGVAVEYNIVDTTVCGAIRQAIIPLPAPQQDVV